MRSLVRTQRPRAAGWGRPNSRVMKGHLKEPSADTGVRAGVSVSLSRNSSQKSEVLQQRFATQKPLKTQGMRPNCETLDFCDTRLLGTLKPPHQSKWPLVPRLLGLGLVGHTGRVRPLAFSPDGSVRATGDEGGTIRLWRR